ncbi:MAG: helix-turn-helix transcriptional regulator [Bacteroidetes bacterium]|nr:helix-turn-helix transcriptional regulator [Bacteroidota bacterium]
MKLLWENEVKSSSSKYYILKRQTPTLRPFLPDHSHDYAELFYVERGSCIHHTNNKDKRVVKGDLLFIQPDTTIHCIKKYDNNLSLLQILFQRGSFSFIKERYQSQEWQTLWDSAGNAIFHFNPMQQLWFENNFNRLLISEHSLLEIERFLLNLLGLIRDTTKDIIIHTNDNWLDKALREIQEPHNFRNGVQGFATLCNRSPEHVEREVKKRTNQTITDIVTQARMSWASYMLIFTDTDILDISDGCGFKSLSYFYKLFKIYFNDSPYRYRKTLKDFTSMSEKKPLSVFFDENPELSAIKYRHKWGK